MAMRMGIIGKKVGMTQVFAEDGERIPVTVIQVGPNYIVGKRTVERDGYSALIIGFGEKPARLVNKPLLGQYKAANVKPSRMVRELRLPPEEVAKYEVGQQLKIADVFQEGAPVDIVATSKGKGFQGVMKRHNFAGGRASHGSMFHRAPGSIGSSAYPSRVFKGMRGTGRMGGDRVTVKNLQIVKIDADQNLIYVRGAVPGPKTAYLAIRRAKRG
jgi:large subunit ribosomal protein L3